MISHYANGSASVEWIRECASVETGRDELEPHQIDPQTALPVTLPVCPAQVRRDSGRSLAEACIEFTFGGYLTVDAIDAEVEIIERHRAFYTVRDDEVTVTRIEHNDARAGRPPLWVPCEFPYYIARTIAQQIEREIEYERVTDEPHMSWDEIAADAAGKPCRGEI